MLAPPQPIATLTVTGAAASFYVLYFTPGQGSVALQAKAVGTSTATSIKIYGSNIYSDHASAGAAPSQASLATSFANNEWVEIPLSGGTLPAGANWTDAFDLGAGSVRFRTLLMVYVNASGTSTLTVYPFGR